MENNICLCKYYFPSLLSLRPKRNLRQDERIGVDWIRFELPLGLTYPVQGGIQVKANGRLWQCRPEGSLLESCTLSNCRMYCETGTLLSMKSAINSHIETTGKNWQSLLQTRRYNHPTHPPSMMWDSSQTFL